MKLTQETIDKLLEWHNEHRAIDIKIQAWDDGIKIWAYDYRYTEGVFIKKIEDLPTDGQLKQLRRERLEAELKELE